MGRSPPTPGNLPTCPATEMDQTPLKLLFVEDDVIAAELLIAQLESSELDCRISVVTTLAGALEELRKIKFDVIVLDLNLPDSHGLDGLELLREESDTPIVVVTALDDEATALEALGKGAQDYLFKGEISTHNLMRSLRYAVERHRLTNSLRELSLLDDLTGLYNRRGFLTLARQQLKVAERMERGAALILADIDNFKRVNDTLGHLEGDKALQSVAGALDHTFRAADIVARWGGDEFVILCLGEERRDIEAAAERLESQLKVEERDYPLEVSVGLHWESPVTASSFDAMLHAADQDLYQQKAARKDSDAP